MTFTLGEMRLNSGQKSLESDFFIWIERKIRQQVLLRAGDIIVIRLHDRY